MNYYDFLLTSPVECVLTGKFQAPSSEWSHFARTLANYEFIVVTEGTAYIQIDQKQYAVSKGEFLLCTPGARQCGFQRSCCAFYWLHFDCGTQTATAYESDTFPAAPGGGHIVLPEFGQTENADKIIVLMKQLQDGVRNYHSSLQSNYACTGILCEVYCQLMSKTQKLENPPKKTQLFNDIQDYVKWYCNSNLRVANIAAHFGYNARYISTMFHSIAGITLKQYITQQKIDSAKSLLYDTNDDINQIAYRLGFSDSHTFMKVFKKQLGLTPTQYRNSCASRLLFYK